MSVTINDGELRRLQGLAWRFTGGLEEAKDLAGQLLVRTSQRGQAAGGKSGRVYGSHQASAPGEYSAPRTWGQHNSIDYQKTGSGFEFGAGQPYSPYLEVGTRKMRPRPDLTNAVNESSEQLGQIIGRSVFNMLIGGR